MYSCSTTNLLKWKIKSRESATLIDILRHASDKTLPFWRDGQYFATFEGNLSSQLVIPYTPGWDGAEVQCMSQNENESLSYAITGMKTLHETMVGVVAK